MEQAADQPPTALATAGSVATGRWRARDAVDAALAAIAGRNGAVNAFCEVRPSAARAAADTLDARLATGEVLGPLAGVPVAVKDVMWEAGVESTNGSRSLLGFVPPQTTAAVERLTAAGAVVVGRTNQPEFCYRGHCANPLYGATANPADLTRTPGGSSGGSAAAVASGMVPLALGSDGGGSVRIPASFCGVVGLKPTFGLIPRDPGWPGWLTLTHVGPIAATVADCALALSVLAGPDDRDLASLPAASHGFLAAISDAGDLRGLRIAVSEDLGGIRIDDAVREAFRAAVERFRALGATLEEVHPPALEHAGEIWFALTACDNVASEGALLGGDLAADTRPVIEAGEALSGSQYAAARNGQHAYARTWGAFMRRYDLVLTPAMECPAFPLGRVFPEQIGGRAIDGDEEWCSFCFPFNLTGQPAISVPMGLADGLPIGLQIVGRRFEDAVVLRAAAAWERLAPWSLPVPPAAGRNGVPEALVEAARSGRERIVLPGDAPVRAGTRVGEAAVRRAYAPRDGEVVVELDLAGA